MFQIWLENADGKHVGKKINLTCGDNCSRIIMALRLEAPQNTYIYQPIVEEVPVTVQPV